MIRPLATVVCAAALCAGASMGRSLTPAAGRGEALPAGKNIVAIDAHPSRVVFDRRYDYAQLLLTGTTADGQRLDITRAVRLAEPCELVEVSPRGIVRAVADGAGELHFEYGDRTITLPVEVSGQADPYEAVFATDVMPILTRAGCNAGGCHGAAKGKNGFQLSLRGYDPDFDHAALTDDLAGRRFNPVRPDQSLFLLKSTSTVPHEGGQVLLPDSDHYEILRTWISQGARRAVAPSKVTSLEIIPAAPTIPQAGMSQQIAVIATFDDGERRDVSAEAFVETGDIEVTSVDDAGLVTALRRGEAAILARYQGQYAATRLLVMGEREGFEWEAAEPHNFIDELVYEKLQRTKTLPSELCTDAEFARRAHLDLTGLAPTVRESRAFLMDARESRLKREELIDRLIGSADFVEYWTNRWADLLQVNARFLGGAGAERFRDWIQAAVASNMPYDEFARRILDSSGSTQENPPVSYFKVLREADVAMENTTQLFMGVRFNCNKCHDHPFERWTRDQHWEMAAFFGRIERKNVPGSPAMPKRNITDEGTPPAYEEIIGDAAEGELTHPDTGAVLAPVFPFEHAAMPASEGSRRSRLAEWMTAAENPYFARSYVNRLWSYFTGAGLIEPVDDIRASNPPTNQALLDRMTEEFVDSGFDVRKLMRTILRSRVYQHSIETNPFNEDDELNYSHARARRLPAEVLFDAVHRAVGHRPSLPGVRPGTRAGELVDPAVKAADGFLDLFGRPPRESACECERSSGMSLGQALNLVNGPTVGDAITDPRNAIAELVAHEADGRAVVEELFLSFLCRMPTDEERARFGEALDPAVLDNRNALGPADRAELDAAVLAWEAANPSAAWTPLDVGVQRSAGGAEFTVLEDRSLLLSGANPEKDTLTLVAQTELVGITGVRLEALSDPKFPGKGPGREQHGNFVLNELSLSAMPLGDPTAVAPVAFSVASASFSQSGYAVAGAVDANPATGWAVHPNTGRSHTAVFETAEDVGQPGGTLLVFTLDEQFGRMHTIGHLRLSVTTSRRPVRQPSLPLDAAEILATPSGQRSEAQHAQLYRHFIAEHPSLAAKIRLSAAQDLAWALANSPAFLFNR
ncbi:MAG: DUF1549 and DUF1553 domain-containing protein [Planctomycetota bacterium]|nr:DUF1549 and DUF1553 domain-containing protein [Planctomycetota bacterium]